MLELGTEVVILAESYPGRVGTVRGILQRSIAGRAIETQYQIDEGWYSEEELAVVVKQLEATPEQSDRDAHFKHFAELLWKELLAVHDGWIDVSSDGLDEEDEMRYKEIIAQRAYDLACHVLDEMNPIAHQYASNNDEILEDVPDMTAFPT